MVGPLTLLVLAGGFEVGDEAAKKPTGSVKTDSVTGEPAAETAVWKTSEVVEKGGDKTFTATGTKKGVTYVFKARGFCVNPSRTPWLGTVRRGRPDRIFGIDFRVTFGGGERQLMNVGERRPLDTALTFTADADDVAIRIEDYWELPKSVSCTIDGIEVVLSP
ncbi:MAG: hypothetical protein JNK82_15315 [Myxococcaceae bacterium]|nr:hypothetical protein [Myxococcaceae bacterium]